MRNGLLNSSHQVEQAVSGIHDYQASGGVLRPAISSRCRRDKPSTRWAAQKEPGQRLNRRCLKFKHIERKQTQKACKHHHCCARGPVDGSCQKRLHLTGYCMLPPCPDYHVERTIQQHKRDRCNQQIQQDLPPYTITLIGLKMTPNLKKSARQNTRPIVRRPN